MKKKIVMLCLISIMSTLLFGCTPPTTTHPVVDNPEVLTSLESTSPTEQIPEATVPEVVPTEAPVDIDIPDEEVTAANLVLGAYNKMRAAEKIKAVSVSKSEGFDENFTVIWDNATGEVLSVMERTPQQAQSTQQSNELGMEAEIQIIPLKVVECVVRENDCYVTYAAIYEYAEDGTWILRDCEKEQMGPYGPSDFYELFAGILNLQLMDETVMLNGEPHYYLVYDRDAGGDAWDMYIKCSDGSLSRLEWKDEWGDYTVDFEEIKESVAVPDDILQAAAGQTLPDAEPEDIVVLFPELGHDIFAKPTQITLGAQTLAIGESARFVADGIPGYECTLDAYYKDGKYLHDDGGQVPAGAYAQYFMSGTYTAEVVFITYNPTQQDVNPEECVIVGIAFEYLEEIAERELTLLDAVTSLGVDYEILATNFGGNIVKWKQDDASIYVASSYDEINFMFIVRPDFEYLVESLLLGE